MVPSGRVALGPGGRFTGGGGRNVTTGAAVGASVGAAVGAPLAGVPPVCPAGGVAATLGAAESGGADVLAELVSVRRPVCDATTPMPPRSTRRTTTTAP